MYMYISMYKHLHIRGQDDEITSRPEKISHVFLTVELYTEPHIYMYTKQAQSVYVDIRYLSADVFKYRVSAESPAHEVILASKCVLSG